ncbi:DUF2723 domain-containing protein [Sphingobacterium hungaricum]
MQYQKINNLLGWLVALIATLTYILTADRTTSWWDTGEFIASAYKLEIVHQPGAPLFLMIQNIFSNFAMGNVSNIALWMNIGSAVCSGLTILFLFWTITALASKILVPKGETANSNQSVQIFSAGFVGALAFAFTDSFWYSAVESEVYAMSSLCTAVVFWLILKWEKRADEPDANRWLLVIAFVMGLSIGVHLLNLLTIPALALFIYFRKTEKITWKGVAKYAGIGILVLAFILWGIIQYTLLFASKFELFFVNTLGLGFGTGVLFFALLVIGLLVYGIVYSIRKSKPVLNFALVATCFVLFGYSSFAMIVIRANANPSLNNNHPNDVFSFLGYLSREQYVSEPLFKGPNYNAEVTGVEKTYSYRKDNDKYTKIEGNSKYTYNNETLFPRMYSAKHRGFYQDYLGLQEGENPTFANNLSFFFKYQLGFMYGRYFMWNFAGRQNDIHGHGNAYDGNWLSGIKSIDNQFVGGQYNLSDEMKTSPSRNTYYFLPLLIGIIGLIWHFKKNKKDAIIVSLLFFFTGIAIVLYLNQSPFQPRERDYAYVGSFYTFAIWIGIGVIAITDVLKRRANLRMATYVSAVVCFVAVPTLLLKENWEDHDRSGRMMTKDFASNYLNSCDPNAILFTYGDNDTFPLWYLQEVEGLRPDVKVVNLSYLQSAWYMKQMKLKTNDADALPIAIDDEKVKKGVRDGLFLNDLQIAEYVDIEMLLDIMLSDKRENQVQMRDGSFVNFLPTKKMKLKVNKDSVIRNKVVPEDWEDAIVESMNWEYNKEYVTRAELSMLSILINNDWKRPIYFGFSLPSECFMGLDKYLVAEGFAMKLMPVQSESANANQHLVNTDTLYKNIKENYVWGNYGKLNHVDVDSRFLMSNFVMNRIFGQSMRSLLAKNELQKAKEIALIAYDNLPKRIESPREIYNTMDIVDTLYKTKENQLATNLVERNVQYLRDRMDYVEAVSMDIHTSLDMETIEFTFASLERYKQVLSENNEVALLNKVSALSDTYKNRYFEN